MNKTKLFISNLISYGLGSIVGKIIPLCMVPVITRLIPNPLYYGLNDLSNTLTAFASSLAIMGMFDAMYRYFFEENDIEYKKNICSTALVFTIITSTVVFLLMVGFCDLIAIYIFNDIQYTYLVYITAASTLIGTTNGIIAAPTQMQNKKKIYIIINTITPILSYLISIPLLLSGFYIIALPIAALVSAGLIETLFFLINKKWFSIKRFDWHYLKMMLKVAIPLAPTFLIYWIFNSSDRIMISEILGADSTGIYSVGAKLGFASQLVYTAFSGGWLFFSYSTMRDVNQISYNSKIIEYLGCISFCTTMFICAIAYSFYKILFVGYYRQGYIVSPYLFLAPLLLMIFQVMTNQFMIKKKTWPITLILLFGALVNVGLNALLIPLFGIEGAGMATLIGYICSVVLIGIILVKKGLVIISRKFIYATIIFIIFSIIWRIWFCKEIVFGIVLAFIGIASIVLVYKEDISLLKLKN